MTDIYCIHPKVNDIDSFLEFTYLKDHISSDSLRWNPDGPSILIATEWIFYKRDLFKKFKSLYKKTDLKIAWMGEAICADMNIFDYWVGFDCDRETDQRFVRLLSPLDMFHKFISTRENELKNTSDTNRILASKSNFCNFLYSNGNAHHMRDDLFYALSRYKKVDSLGKHLNNVTAKGTGYAGHAHECVALKSPYKFSIASENASYNGYTSEKIFTSLIAHTIPIYWGNPSIDKDVNPECFINAGTFSNLKDVTERVREIDSDPALWSSIVSKPWLTPEQTAYHKQRSEDYFRKLSALLSGDVPAVVPEGYHIDLYRKHFFDGEYKFDRNIREKIISRLRHCFI